MGRYSYPHTIDNGAGERLTFLRRVAGAAGDRLEVENVVEPGAGPPMHVHHYQEEVLTVREGRIGYQRPGEPARYAGPGETVAFRAGDAHKFWNAGEGKLRCTGHVEPADNVEYFLGQVREVRRRARAGGTPLRSDLADGEAAVELAVEPAAGAPPSARRAADRASPSHCPRATAAVP